MESCIFFPNFHSFLFPPFSFPSFLSLPFLCVPFLSGWVSSSDPVRGSGEPQAGLGRARPINGLMYFELKITLPVTALCRSFQLIINHITKFCRTMDVVLAVVLVVACPQNIPIWCFSERGAGMIYRLTVQHRPLFYVSRRQLAVRTNTLTMLYRRCS